MMNCMDFTQISIFSFQFCLLGLLGAASAASVCYQAALMPVAGSYGTGSAKVIVDGSTITSTITFDGLSGNTTAAHIHAPTMVAFQLPGPVLVSLSGSLPMGVMNGSFTDISVPTNASIPSALVTYANAGLAYVNIHTNLFPAGEINGFLVPCTSVCYQTTLMPVSGSQGTGSAKVTVANGTTITSTVSFTGLSGNTTAAHIHAPTANAFQLPGPVLVSLSSSLPMGVMNGSFTDISVPINASIPAELVTYANESKAYINVHTTLFPAGEINGFLVPCTSVCYQATLMPVNGSHGTGSAKIIIDDTSITSTVTFSGLSGNTTIAHIHAPTANAFQLPGPVFVSLTSSLPVGVMAGQFTDVTMPLNGTIPPTLIVYANAGKAYVNIHTTLFPAGEINGFLVPCAAATNPTSAPTSGVRGHTMGRLSEVLLLPTVLLMLRFIL